MESVNNSEVLSQELNISLGHDLHSSVNSCNNISKEGEDSMSSKSAVLVIEEAVTSLLTSDSKNNLVNLNRPDSFNTFIPNCPEFQDDKFETNEELQLNDDLFSSTPDKVASFGSTILKLDNIEDNEKENKLIEISLEKCSGNGTVIDENKKEQQSASVFDVMSFDSKTNADTCICDSPSSYDNEKCSLCIVEVRVNDTDSGSNDGLPSLKCGNIKASSELNISLCNKEMCFFNSLKNNECRPISVEDISNKESTIYCNQEDLVTKCNTKSFVENKVETKNSFGSCDCLRKEVSCEENIIGKKVECKLSSQLKHSYSQLTLVDDSCKIPNADLMSLEIKENVPCHLKSIPNDVASLSHMLSSCSMEINNAEGALASKVDLAFSEFDIKRLEEIFETQKDEISSFPEDIVITNSLKELYKNGRGLSLDDDSLLGFAHSLTSELEKNLYSNSLGLEDIINAAVNEIGLEFSHDKDFQEQLRSLDSDSKMITDSVGLISSCTLSTTSEAPQNISEALSNSFSMEFFPGISQDSCLEEEQVVIEDREGFGKRGDADGCSLSNSDDANFNKVSDIVKTDFSTLSANENESENDSSCSCQRPDVIPHEENGSVLMSAWNELRSSLRQLHRSVVPSSLTKSGLSNPRNRPSINRIKALSNMLLAHDPHQLFTRVNQLSQELCIELKVRLLATIHDKPDFDEACTFIQALCESYEWVISVCEAIQSAFEKLDAEYLSSFGLNWMTVNMHTFYATIFTDPDVQDYLILCTTKAEEFNKGQDAMGCLASLKRTLTVAEGVWCRAERSLQEYAMERAAYNAQRRQLLSEWGQLKSRHNSYNKYTSQPSSSATKYISPQSYNTDFKGDSETGNCTSVLGDDNILRKCPCHNCHTNSNKDLPSSSNAIAQDNLINGSEPIGESEPNNGSCECHFCNSTSSQSQPSSGVLSTSNANVLPPLTQPQLSLYPHIHGTTVGSDIVSNPCLEDLGTIPGAPTVKPPIFANPYLGSDLLTEQLIREWDLVYGDTLSPPSFSQSINANKGIMSSDKSLSNNLEKMSLNNRPSYTRQMQEPDEQIVKSPNFSHSKNSIANSHIHEARTVTPLSTHGSMHSKSFEDTHIQKCTNVPTHAQNCKIGNSAANNVSDRPKQRTTQMSSERSSSRDSPSDVETSDPDDWSSGDESDASSSSTAHQGAHCDCCYCHMLQSMPGGGRQKYSDRRDRLLKILSHKKKTSCSSASSGFTATSTGGCTGILHQQKEKDKALGHQTVDEIMNFIEGKRTGTMCHKKAAKKARQKERKLAMKRQEECNRKKSSSSSSTKSSYRREDDFDDDEEEDELDYYDDESEELPEEEEEDGPLAELRRRAPDVTITVVKPSHQQGQKASNAQKNINKDAGGGGKHPLVAKQTSSVDTQPSNVWTPPRPSLPGARAMSVPSNTNAKDSCIPSGASAPGGLSSLLKDMDVLSKDQDKDGKGSQMVTIRRIMDPVSSEPTVTITLKGEEPKKDKVLFKLVNGQACQGDNVANTKNQPKPVPKVKIPQEKPVYDIPEGLDPEEAKKLKKKQKKDRQKQRKEFEKIEEQKQEQYKQLQLQKQQEYLKQQQAVIQKQQEALHRQQEELLRQQKKGAKGNKNKDKKGKGHDRDVLSGKGKNVAAMVYDKDDVARNFNLPPGVSINKVAGQPGMVTISNTMGNPFTQPFLPNPNMYPNPVMQSYNLGGSQGYPVSSPSSSMGYPGIFGGCGSPSMPWNDTIDPCTGAPQESVIVVDTKSSTSKPNSSSKYGDCNTKSNKKCRKNLKSFDEMSSEEKIEAAIKGEIDSSQLNITQKKKYKKAIKALKEEKENALLKQREEDELMDRMYEMAKGQIPVPPVVRKDSKSNKFKGKDASRLLSAQSSGNCPLSVSSIKPGQSTKPKNKVSNCLPTTKNKTNASKLQEKYSSTIETKSSDKGQQEQQKQKHHQKEVTKKVNENLKKANLKSDVQCKQSVPQNKQMASKLSTSQPAPPNRQAQQGVNMKEVLPQHQQNSKKPKQVQQQGQQIKLPQQSHQLELLLENQQKQIKQNQQHKPRQNHQQIIQKQNSQHANKSMQQVKLIPEKQSSDQNHQASKNILQQRHLEPQQIQQQKSFIKNKKTQFDITSKPHMKSDSKPVMKARHSLKSSQPGKENDNAYSFGQSVGYTATDIGHEARYAQYLAANASTLATVEFEANQIQKSPSNEHGFDSQKKGKKRGKRGHLEDMTTIDSVFTPKDGPGGELDDETDREVEAFKRFCLYNVPRSAGEKPKVNFNVKDIMIKKKH